MKRLNKKLMTLLLAGVCATSLGMATVGVEASADETPVKASTFAISDVFASDGKLDPEQNTVAFTLGNGQYARIKRDLAFKWYEGKNDARYLTIKFAFKELNFKSVTLEIESAPSVATEDGKSVNAVEFTVENGQVYATVRNGEDAGEKKLTEITAGSEVTLALSEGDKFDSYSVLLNGSDIGEFTYIGASYADYTYEKIHPLEITAETEGENEAVVLLKEINGQRFDNVENNQITDTAAPVLVVNEDVSGFQFGTAFSLAYEKVDVLQSSSLTEAKRYYQYNPADTETNYEKTLTTSTYFMDTVYYVNGTEVSKTAKEGFTATSVMAQEGKEYISMRVTLGDDTFDDTKSGENIPFPKKVYDLSWYAQDSAVVTKSLGSVETDYIVIDKNVEGPSFAFVENVGTETVVPEAQKDALNKAVEAYQKLLADEAKDTYAGSNSNITLPAVDWLIKDNGGYRGMRFTISYKTPSSTGSAKSSSGLSYNGLKLSTTEEGLYEFKIFASDKAGNTMKYYVDGELVDVTTSNVWDIDAIPSFTFKIANLGIKVEEPSKASDRMAEKILDQTYTLSGLKVVGASNQQSKYALYRLDDSAYNGPAITENVLTGVKYEDIRTAALTKLDKVGTDYETYFDLYLDIYAEKIAAAIDGDKAAVKACFKEIKAYNANITESDKEWNEYNKYKWNTSSKSFSTVEEGEYLILADFWEKDLPMQRAAGYKVVVVESKADVIEGDSDFSIWVENNKVSVILFGVAALMLIAIIILLFVKPSDETLEDVEKKAAKKKNKSKKNKEKKSK